MYIAESQAVGRWGEGVISPGAEFYHRRRTGGLCTFSPLPCTLPMHHLYLLIPVGWGEGGTGGWEGDAREARNWDQDCPETADPHPSVIPEIVSLR